MIMKQGKVWNDNVSGRRVDEFNLTFEGTDWIVRRIQHHDTGDTDYVRRNINKFHTSFEDVPEEWKPAIDRVIDEEKPFQCKSTG